MLMAWHNKPPCLPGIIRVPHRDLCAACMDELPMVSSVNLYDIGLYWNALRYVSISDFNDAIEIYFI